MVEKMEEKSGFLSEGDLDAARSALQDRLSEWEPRIRRRLRGKYRFLESLGAFDLDDVMVSARRRLDEAVVRKSIVATYDQQVEVLFERTARNVAIDIVRRESQRKRIESDASQRCTHQRSESDDSALSGLKRIVPQLDTREQEALQLYARGASPRWIATKLGVPLREWRSQWRRLKSRVRRLLDDNTNR